MGKWFRVYDDLVDDPKVQRLPAELFKALINLWCLASQNDGLLPPLNDISFKLRMKPERVYKLMGELRTAGLIDDDETGTHPHNWNGRQFKSDNSTTDRVKRFRNKQRNVSGNGNETFHVTQTETPPDTDTDTEQIQNRTDISIPSVSHCGRSATRSAVDQAFDEFWKAYPKRDGANPRAPAAKKFAAALKAGSSAEELVAGARAYRSACDEGKLTGTAMVAQAITWLNQQRWGDYRPRDPPLAEPEPTSEQLAERQRMIELGEKILNGQLG